MKKMKAIVLCLLLMCATANAEAPEVTYGNLLADMLEAYDNPSDEAIERINLDEAALDEDVANSIAGHWKKVYLAPDYKLFLYGKDDPAKLDIHGAHAIVVLGFELKDGEMTDELKGRCDAAAELARSFPDSILVCSGGATGKNNPEGHTEAGLMKAYLVEKCGIDADRIHIDEKAMTTAENAVNTFAILKDHGIETMTIVTSSYHQKRGQTLYNALAALYRQEHGYSAEIIGNYCYDIEPASDHLRDDAGIAIVQLANILQLPEAQMALLPDLRNRQPKKKP